MSKRFIEDGASFGYVGFPDEEGYAAFARAAKERKGRFERPCDFPLDVGVYAVRFQHGAYQMGLSRV